MTNPIGRFFGAGSTTITTRYLHRDHLGSVTTVTDETGALVERLAYEPFGKRRYPTGVTDPNGLIRSLTTTRGFTNQEELDALGLIHMNGRIYDPVVGRFTSADPTVPEPEDPQSYNRFSYVRNNPLNFTDPTGFTDVPNDGAAARVPGSIGPEGPGTQSADVRTNPQNNQYGIDNARDRAATESRIAVIETKMKQLDADWYYKNASNSQEYARLNSVLFHEKARLSILRAEYRRNVPSAQWTQVDWKEFWTDVATAFGGRGVSPAGLTRLSGAAAKDATETTRVGRWMSGTEFKAMKDSGRVVEGAGGRTYVVNPANPDAFTSAGRGSSVYAEFDVPTNVLKRGSKPEWSVIPGPNVTTRLYGPAPAELAPATCIVCVIGKP